MRLDKALLDLAAEQQSCIADWQVRLLGATNTEITRLKRSQRWTLVGQHVLVVAGVEHSDVVLASAAVLSAGNGAVLSHLSALALWDQTGFQLRPASVSHVNGRAMRRQPVGVHHPLVVVPEKWVTTFKGIRVVRPELAAYQACGILHPARAARTFDNLWSRRLLSGRSARRCLEDLARRGRDGTIVYREILAVRGDDYVPPTTNLEARMNELAQEAAIRVRRQVDLGGDEHWDGRVDFLCEDAPLVIEVQSEMYHSALLDLEADAARRKKIEKDGFTVLELWDVDVWTRASATIAALQTAVWNARYPSKSSA